MLQRNIKWWTNEKLDSLEFFQARLLCRKSTTQIRIPFGKMWWAWKSEKGSREKQSKRHEASRQSLNITLLTDDQTLVSRCQSPNWSRWWWCTAGASATIDDCNHHDLYWTKVRTTKNTKQPHNLQNPNSMPPSTGTSWRPTWSPQMILVEVA